MAEQESSHTPEVGEDPDPNEGDTPVSPRKERLLDNITDVIWQTLEEHKKDSDKGKEKATRESSKREGEMSLIQNFQE